MKEKNSRGMFEDNDIHSTVIISGDVKIGRKNRILPYTILTGPLEIGDNNIIGPHCIIGSTGGDTRNPRYDSSQCRIRIGSNNIIREFCSIQKPAYKEITQIGDDCHLMQGIHLGHDTIVENKTVISALVSVGGLVHLSEGSNLAQGSTVHQKAVVGHYSIVGMGAPLVKNLRPFSRYIPGKPLTVNKYALKKFGYLDFEDEVVRYVEAGQMPRAEPVQMIVETYKKMHLESGREEY